MRADLLLDDPLLVRALRLWGRPGADVADFREVYADPVRINGVETPVAQLVAQAAMLLGALDGLTHHVDVVAVADGRRSFAFRITGRHTGPLATPLGVIEATGCDVEVGALDIFEVDESAGLVTAIWSHADWLALVRSLADVRLG